MFEIAAAVASQSDFGKSCKTTKSLALPLPLPLPPLSLVSRHGTAACPVPQDPESCLSAASLAPHASRPPSSIVRTSPSHANRPSTCVVTVDVPVEVNEPLTVLDAVVLAVIDTELVALDEALALALDDAEVDNVDVCVELGVVKLQFWKSPIANFVMISFKISTDSSHSVLSISSPWPEHETSPKNSLRGPAYSIKAALTVKLVYESHLLKLPASRTRAPPRSKHVSGTAEPAHSLNALLRMRACASHSSSGAAK